MASVRRTRPLKRTLRRQSAASKIASLFVAERKSRLRDCFGSMEYHRSVRRTALHGLEAYATLEYRIHGLAAHVAMAMRTLYGFNLSSLPRNFFIDADRSHYHAADRWRRAGEYAAELPGAARPRA